MKKIILMLLIVFTLTGCYNYQELNKVAIVSSIGVDKVDDMYEVTVQIMNAKEDKESEGSQVAIYSEKANSILYALRQITMKSPRKLNGSHLGKLVLSKDVAKENIIDIIDNFERLSQTREEINIMIVDNDTAKHTLSVLTTTENVPSEYVKREIETSFKNTSLTYNVKMDEFVSEYLKKYIDPTIPVIKLVNYDKDGTTMDNINTTKPISKIIVTDKLGITDNGKVIDYLNKDEIYGFNFLNNNVKTPIIEIKCDNEDYASVSINNKTKYDIKKMNNKYEITYHINIKGEINEYTCNKNIKNEDNVKEIENKIKKQISKDIEKVLKKDKENKSNFLGIKRKVYLYDSKYNDEDINVKYDIKVNINKKGQLNNSIKGEKNE